MQKNASFGGIIMQLNASLVIFNEKGEQIGKSSQWKIDYPDQIKVESEFAKIHYDEFKIMTNSHKGRCLALLNHIEYQTNKLVHKGKGKKTVPLKQKDIIGIVGLKNRAGANFIREMRELKAIMKINKCYYLNPRFAMRSKSIDSEIIVEMVKIDPKIIKKLNKKEFKILKHYIQVKHI